MEGVLSNEAVEVVAGNAIVEVKPQGVSKGGAVERILQELSRTGRAPDFILCIGDDRSDEDMFEAIDHSATRTVPSPVRSLLMYRCLLHVVADITQCVVLMYE